MKCVLRYFRSEVEKTYQIQAGENRVNEHHLVTMQM